MSKNIKAIEYIDKSINYCKKGIDLINNNDTEKLKTI